MQRVIIVIAAILLAFLLQWWLPWWSVALVGFLVGVFGATNTKNALLLGFLSIFLCWTIQAGWITMQNEGILASRMGILLGGAPGILLPFIGGIIGGLVGALGAWSGWLFRKWAF